MPYDITKTLLVAALLVVAFVGSGKAEGYDHAAVYDRAGQIVRTENAECLQTKWIVDRDPCAAKVVVQKERVAQQTKVVQQMPKAIRTRELTQDAKTVYFVFNRSLLTEESKTRLNALAAALKSDVSVKEAKIVGFADRIGSNAYNEQLSQKRAEAVRDYLIVNGYTNARVTETRWAGEEQPTTNCAFAQKLPQLISCLQNDRRVEVEMVYINKEQLVQAQ